MHLLARRTIHAEGRCAAIPAALPPPLTEELMPLGYRRLFPYKLAVCGLYLTVYWEGVDGRRALWQAIRLEFAAAVLARDLDHDGDSYFDCVIHCAWP